jgi:tryptophanyl-tRNA synthetase
MTEQTDKAKAFFILHDADVVERKVMDVFIKMFDDGEDRKQSRDNAMNFLYTLMVADRSENHPVMDRVLAEMFHSGRLGHGGFMNNFRDLIRGIVQEQITRAMNDIERRMADLKRAEYSSRYKL